MILDISMFYRRQTERQGLQKASLEYGFRILYCAILCLCNEMAKLMERCCFWHSIFHRILERHCQLISVSVCFKNMQSLAGEMAQSGKFLPHKQEDVSLIFITHIKM